MQKLRVSFHTDGTVRDIGPDGDFDLPGTSTLALRYRLEEGENVEVSELMEWVGKSCMDSMGLGSIIYFPGTTK